MKIFASGFNSLGFLYYTTLTFFLPMSIPLASLIAFKADSSSEYSMKQNPLDYFDKPSLLNTTDFIGPNL
jgi:hypothetical protein